MPRRWPPIRGMLRFILDRHMRRTRPRHRPRLVLDVRDGQRPRGRAGRSRRGSVARRHRTRTTCGWSSTARAPVHRELGRGRAATCSPVPSVNCRGPGTAGPPLSSPSCAATSAHPPRAPRRPSAATCCCRSTSGGASSTCASFSAIMTLARRATSRCRSCASRRSSRPTPNDAPGGGSGCTPDSSPRATESVYFRSGGPSTGFVSRTRIRYPSWFGWTRSATQRSSRGWPSVVSIASHRSMNFRSCWVAMYALISPLRPCAAAPRPSGRAPA